MKRMFWILIPAIMLMVLLLVGCDRNDPADTDAIDGGVQHDTSYDAPKVIKSTEITDFSCTFSALTMLKEDTPLAGNKYSLKAKLENGVVEGSYRAQNRADGKSIAFHADTAFMDALQAIVTAHDLAQHNGHSYRVSGLPDNFGAVLSIDYASGENIYASNNQTCFLSHAAMEDLEALFRAQIEPAPAALDLSVTEDLITDHVNGSFLSISYPILTLGHAHWDGRYRSEASYPALEEALDAYNQSVCMDQEALLKYTLRPEAERNSGGTPLDLHSLMDVYVTRSDDRVVAFYETMTLNTGIVGTQHFRRTFNYDTATGKQLHFADVFTDAAALPALLAKAFAQVDPELAQADALAGPISRAIDADDGTVCFALANGGVHFFAEKNPLGGPVGIVHTMLSYAEYPELVRERYRPTADRWLIRLAYDTEYSLPDGIMLRMQQEVSDHSGDIIEWTLTINGSSRSETFYGAPPVCWLVHSETGTFFYLEEPSGDISHSTRVCTVTSDGLTECGTAAMAMYAEANYDPAKLLMVENDSVFAGDAMVIPYGIYHIGEDGLPIPSAREKGLMGPTLALTRDVEATFADQYDPSFEDGPLPLAAGTLLTPFRTDQASYVDFFDEEGQVCRFAIEGFTDQMRLNHYGTLDELLVLP